MDTKDIKYYEELLSLTAHPEWAALREEITKEIWNIQGNLLEGANSWDQICFAKGYVAALSSIVNLRETAEQILDNRDEL